MNAEDRLRDALNHRADEVEPNSDSYARLAQRVDDADRRATTWWQSPKLLWLTAAGGAVAALVAVVALGIFTDDEPDRVATPDLTSTPAPAATTPPTAPTTPTPTVDEPTPETASPTPTPGPVGPPASTVGAPDAIIWPAAAFQPFGEWPSTPEDAAAGFVASVAGYDLPIGNVTFLDPIALLADVSLQSRGEDGEPFGEAIKVRVAGGFDDNGNQNWGVRWARSDMIVIDGWNVIDNPPSLEPRGRGWAFEGTIDAVVVTTTGDIVGQGFVMGGGLELLELRGSIPLGPTPAGSGFAVFSDVGGLGIAPTAMTIIEVSWPEIAEPEPIDQPETTCSATGLEAPADDPTLPDEVAEMRREIITFALACDYEALGGLSAPDFSFSFGGGTDPAAYWRDVEANGGEPLRFMVELLRRTWAFDDLAGNAYYVWPVSFLTEWSEVSDAARDELRPLYDDADFASFEEFGGYFGWRLAIDDSGNWRFFLAGD